MRSDTCPIIPLGDCESNFSPTGVGVPGCNGRLFSAVAGFLNADVEGASLIGVPTVGVVREDSESTDIAFGEVGELPISCCAIAPRTASWPSKVSACATSYIYVFVILA